MKAVLLMAPAAPLLKRLRCLLTLAHAREVYGVYTAWKPYGRNLRGMRAACLCKGCHGELS